MSPQFRTRIKRGEFEVEVEGDDMGQVKAMVDAYLDRQGLVPNVPRGGKSRQTHTKSDRVNKRPDTGQRRSATGKKKGAYRPQVVRNLNLKPKGQASLRDFVKKKQPKDNQERSALFVYYLGKVAGIDAITCDHVYTCYKDISGLRVPADLPAQLCVVASRKGWIDTRDMENIRITVPGENFVEHDLPHEKGDKGI